MELGKITPLTADPIVTRVGTDASPAAALPMAPGNGGAGSTDAAAALADEVSIHPLDVAGALQILLTEVRASLTLPGELPGELPVAVSAHPMTTGLPLPGGEIAPPPSGGPVPPAAGDAVRAELALLEVAVRGDYSALAATPLQATAATAPLLLVHMLLKSLPDDEKAEPAAWLAAAARAEASLRSGMDKAVDAVTAWRNVPALVVAVARDTRAVVLAVVGEDPPSPLWLRPEWLGLAPRMERFWRRRRRARRNLRDPDRYPQVPEPYEPPAGGER